MSNYVKQTWTDGVSSVSAARMNVIEQGIYDAHYKSAARVYHSVAQSVSDSTQTTLQFNSERFDTDSIHDPVTDNSRLTCQTAGIYQISASVEFAYNATGVREVFLRLNGTTMIEYVAVPAFVTYTKVSLSTLYQLSVNDYVEVRAYQDSGGDLNVTSTGNYSPEFMMVRVA